MQVYVRPRREAGNKHVLVRIPGSWSPLPREGAWVSMDEYWARRLRDEDVVEVTPPEENDPGDGVEKTPVPAEEQPDGSLVGTTPADPPEPEEPTAAKRRGR